MSSASDPRITNGIWEREPIFHERRDFDGENIIFICGRRREWNRYSLHQMRRDHAERIGRPCFGCLKKGMAWRFRAITTHQAWRYAS